MDNITMDQIHPGQLTRKIKSEYPMFVDRKCMPWSKNTKDFIFSLYPDVNRKCLKTAISFLTDTSAYMSSFILNKQRYNFVTKKRDEVITLFELHAMIDKKIRASIVIKHKKFRKRLGCILFPKVQAALESTEALFNFITYLGWNNNVSNLQTSISKEQCSSEIATKTLNSAPKEKLKLQKTAKNGPEIKIVSKKKLPNAPKITIEIVE